MNRRDILRAIALGGGVVAGELWIPGQRVVSIPSGLSLNAIRHPVFDEIIQIPKFPEDYIGSLCEKSIEQICIYLAESKADAFIKIRGHAI